MGQYWRWKCGCFTFSSRHSLLQGNICGSKEEMASLRTHWPWTQMGRLLNEAGASVQVKSKSPFHNCTWVSPGSGEGGWHTAEGEVSCSSLHLNKSTLRHGRCKCSLICRSHSYSPHQEVLIFVLDLPMPAHSHRPFLPSLFPPWSKPCCSSYSGNFLPGLWSVHASAR